MKISATIQARMGSRRLPGKVLLPILGKPMLARQIERIQKSLLVDEVIIATSSGPADDPIAALGQGLDVPVFRGSENDVLGRVASALTEFDVDVHVELYGDCPLPDPTIIDSVVGFYLKHRDTYEYVGTGLKTTFPPGLEVTVYAAGLLQDAATLVERPEDREHVAIHIRSRTERYRTYNLEAPPHFRYPDLHLEVDTEEDFKVVTAIYEALYPVNPDFLLSDIVDLLRRNPDLAQMNRNVPRRWAAFRQD